MSLFARARRFFGGASDAVPSDVVGDDDGDGGDDDGDGGGGGGGGGDVVQPHRQRRQPPPCACCGETRLATSRIVAADMYEDLALLTAQELDASTPRRLCTTCFVAFREPIDRISSLSSAFAVSRRHAAPANQP